MKTILMLLMCSSLCYSQTVFVSPDISIGSSTASKDYKGEFGIGGRLGIGLKFGKYSFSLIGGASNFTFSDKGYFATDARGNKTNMVNTSYSSTYIDLGIKAVVPIYAPNNDGLYFTIAPEYNKLNSINYTTKEENNSKSTLNREGNFTGSQLSTIGNSFSLDLGIQYRIVGKNEFAFGAFYKTQLNESVNYPRLGFMGINVAYQFNFSKSPSQ